MDIDYDALRKLFVTEADEALNQMEISLLRLEEAPHDREALASVFRIVHTIKGDAGTVGYEAPAAYAHRFEDLLDTLRRERAPVTPRVVTLLLRGGDALRELIHRSAAGDVPEAPAESALLDELAETLLSSTGEERGAAAGEARPYDSTPAEERRRTTMRVDLDRLDELLTLVGEIAVSRGKLDRRLADPEIEREEVFDEHQESARLHRELQELVMKLRMVPVGPTFHQYARLVRDQATRLGKQAHLIVEGGNVEVDNSVLQALRDPLTHMVRNAIDHALEAPEARRAAGKPASGSITLRARHVAGSIVVDVEDDGAGIDRERLLAKARAEGRVSAHDEPSERELFEIIFEPGFSTASEVTDLSGRGVGMDVVRNGIEALRGSIDISSRPGTGTRISIRLPLTLAIIDGLLIRIVDQTYVVPLDSVVESLDLPASETGSPSGEGLVELRGRTVPYVRLRELFALGAAPSGRENVVVVRMEDREAGLVVDEVSGKSQIVIKPLARLFQRLPGISGSAILGDGEVAMILDVPRLLERHAASATLTTHPRGPSC